MFLVSVVLLSPRVLWTCYHSSCVASPVFSLCSLMSIKSNSVLFFSLRFSQVPRPSDPKCTAVLKSNVMWTRALNLLKLLISGSLKQYDKKKTTWKSGAKMNTDRFLKYITCLVNYLYHFKVKNAVTYYSRITKPHVHMRWIMIPPHAWLSKSWLWRRQERDSPSPQREELSGEARYLFKQILSLLF